MLNPLEVKGPGRPSGSRALSLPEKILKFAQKRRNRELPNNESVKKTKKTKLVK